MLSNERSYWSIKAAIKRPRRSGPKAFSLPAVTWDSVATAELAAFGLASLSADEACVASQLRGLAQRMREEGARLGRTA
jgi:hypothetical protein